MVKCRFFKNSKNYKVSLKVKKSFVPWVGFGFEPGTSSIAVQYPNHQNMEPDDENRQFLVSISKVCKNQLILKKKLPPLKHILALQLWVLICIVSELQSFEIGKFDLGRPVFCRNLQLYRVSKIKFSKISLLQLFI